MCELGNLGLVIIDWRSKRERIRDEMAWREGNAYAGWAFLVAAQAGPERDLNEFAEILKSRSPRWRADRCKMLKLSVDALYDIVARTQPIENGIAGCYFHGVPC